MEPSEQLRQLCELAGEAGLSVRELPGGDEPAPVSAVCRVRGELWVVLSRADSLDERIAVVAGALREHAADFLESHYLPPALRARLGAADEPA